MPWCSVEANVTECVIDTIRYTHFHWLIYKLKRSWQEVTRTCLKRSCVRSFHERQKQTESEMKGLIFIRLKQREITLRIALRGIMYIGRGLVLNCLDREDFVRRTQTMASTFVHSIEKKINVWHTLNINIPKHLQYLFYLVLRTGRMYK